MCIGSCVHALVLVPGRMGKGKFRTLEELYHSTEQVSEPFKFEIEEKCRTCNLCATGHSSCMHNEQVAAIVSVGTDDFTDKTYEEKRTSQCSSNDGVLFSPSLSGACECRQLISSDASNICSVSPSHDSFSENAIQAAFGDFDSCKDIEFLLNIRRAQPDGESGDTPKDLTNFGNQRFSNQLEKHKELEILGDDISFISRSENGGPDRKNVSCISASDDSFPVVEKDVKERLVYPFVAGTQCDEANCNHHDAQNFAEESPLAGVVIPNRSDQSDISSLKDFYDCAISVKHEPSECLSEQVESSLARAAMTGLDCQVDGIYSSSTFVGADLHLNCFETESHSNCKKHLQKSVAVTKNTRMEDSWQSQPAEPRVVSDLMDDEVRVCDICGNAGREDSLAICNKCTDGAEHIYCMGVKPDKVPESDWMCEECMLKSDTETSVQRKVEEAARIPKGCPECQKSEISVNLESRASAKLKFRSLQAWKSGTKGVSSASHLSAKRHGVPLEAHSAKKVRLIGTSAVPPPSSKPCNNNTLLHRDFPCKNFKNGKVEAGKDIASVLQFSCNSQGNSKVLHACGDERHEGTLEAELDEKRWALETKEGVSIQTVGEGKTSKQSLSFKKLGKAKLEAAPSVSSVKSSSYGTEEKAKLPSRLGDEPPKLGPQSEIADDKCSLVKSRSSKAADLKFKGQLEKGGCLQKQKDETNLAFHDNRRGKDLRILSKFVSFNSVSSEKPNAMLSRSVSFNSVSSEKPNATCCEILLANAYCPLVLKNSSSAKETETAKGKDASKLHHTVLCLLASDSGVHAVKSGKKNISSDETFFTVSNCCKLDGVQSCGQLDCRLQPSSHKAHKDLNCPNEEKKNDSWQAEYPTEAATAMKLHQLCTGLAYDKGSQFEAAILSEGFVIPKPDYIWLGKFQIHSREEIASICDGIQAHLSTCASCKVLEVVDRLPEIIILEELPRLSMWPSQFIGSQATEENIALYFFAKDLDSYRTYYTRLMEYMTKNDLALKGNLDGVELLIFPSNVLPEKSQRWNKLLFFWGVFRGRKVNNSANTPVSNSQELENRDIVRSCALDLNAYPQEGNEVVRVDKIDKFDSIGKRSSGDRILLGGDSYNAGCSYSSKATDRGGEKKSLSAVIDLNLSLWPESETPKDGPFLLVGNADNKTDKKVRGKLLMDKKISADNVEPSKPPSATIYDATPKDGSCLSVGTADGKIKEEMHGKLLRDEQKNIDNVEPSRPPSSSPALPTIYDATPKDGLCLSVGTAESKAKEEMHGKLLMGEDENVEPSRPSSVSLCEENMDPLEMQAVDTLMFLSKGIRKF